MRLHENWELFSDALQAASQPVEDGGLGIKSIFIEKDYWICRSLSLMAANDKDDRAIFKGGTSLTKAYGIGSRFSEVIDIAISEAWMLSGNQLKMLIKRTAKSMTEGLQEMNMPGFTSKGSHYHKAYYSYPRAIDTLQIGAIKAGQLLVEINSFANKSQVHDVKNKPPFWQLMPKACSLDAQGLFIRCPRLVRPMPVRCSVSSLRYKVRQTERKGYVWCKRQEDET